MKNILRIILNLVVCILGLTQCHAQQILPLNTSTFNIPAGTYFKDLNNEFGYYLGSWKGNYQDKIITLSIVKVNNKPFEMWDRSYYHDQIIVRYEIKNINGNILQSTLNSSFNEENDVHLLIESSGTEANGNVLKLLFAGGNCSVGIGEIILKKINNTQFYWSYYPGTTTRNDITCPPNLDYNIYLPETENLIFTKQ